MWGSPASISIEPTTACNLGCPECPSGLKKFTRAEGNLKEGFLTDLFGQLKNYKTEFRWVGCVSLQAQLVSGAVTKIRNCSGSFKNSFVKDQIIHEI